MPDAQRIGATYEACASNVSPGERVLLDDGLIELVVLSANSARREVRCRVIYGGILKERKGINLPDTRLRMPSVTPKDREGPAPGASTTESTTSRSASFATRTTSPRSARPASTSSRPPASSPRSRSPRRWPACEQVHRGVRRDHGRPRRPGRRDAGLRGPRHPEAADPRGDRPRPLRHHRDPNARVHDRAPPPDARRGGRRRERDLRRDRRRHAQRRDRLGKHPSRPCA